MKNILRHLSSFAAPIVMCLVLPYLIIRLEHKSPIPTLNHLTGLLIPGAAVTAFGFILLIATIRMFIRIGDGTIMPWDAAKKFITVGLYAYVRNPMIFSLIILQAGEAMLFASYGVAALAFFDLVLNTIYFRFSEEPGLEQRFGTEYVEYKKHVPMWIPRLKQWQSK